MDVYCLLQGATVYSNYTCMLTQANIVTNANKFYGIQLLEHGKVYVLWTRYGRIGEKGRTESREFGDLERAIIEFKRRYKAKTGTAWGKTWTPAPQKYAPASIVAPKIEIVQEEAPVPPSTLDTSVQRIVRMISDSKMMTSTLKELNLDTQKMPLGKISDTQIDKAQRLLDSITTTTSAETLIATSSEFWTLIPFACGRKPPPIINSSEQVKKCSELLHVMRNIEAAGKMIQKAKDVDSVYAEIGVEMTPVERGTPEWDVISLYVKNTQGSTHGRVELEEAIKIHTAMNEETMAKVGNRMLLFHGTRMANVLGILQRGFRLPHLNDHVSNGSTLGRGIYFANSVTKSFNYCFSDMGIVLLCDVALGTIESCRTMSDKRVRSTFDSRMGCGEYSPDSAADIVFEGAKVPLGKLVAETRTSHSSFIYDEYAIYNPSQYRFKYLLLLRQMPDTF